MRRLILVLTVLLPTLTFAQDNRSGGSMRPNQGGCIGGSACKERILRVELEDRPVIAVHFYAHDKIGNKTDGVLRIRIDGELVHDRLDIPRDGESFTLPVNELQGRYLIFEPATDDEVELSEISVKYGIARRTQEPSGGTAGTGGWRPYREMSGCIGGDLCRQNGKRITVGLEDAPVLGIRFFAHDAIGQRTDGRLTVRIDNEVIDGYLDVRREGKRHEFETDNLRGSRLVIETVNDDEVQIKDIEVLYGHGGERSGGSPEITDEGKCIGGDRCGGDGERIRIPIQRRAVNNIRFYAANPTGQGKLRITIDADIVEPGLEVPREGRTLVVDGRRLDGDYLTIQPVGNVEMEVRHIRVRFE